MTQAQQQVEDIIREVLEGEASLSCIIWRRDNYKACLALYDAALERLRVIQDADKQQEGSR